MDTLTKKEIQELIDAHGNWCVSLYVPTHRSLPEARQDPIRFKNVLRDAEADLESRGLRSPDIAELLKPAEELLADPLFWRYQSDGLAAFLSRDRFRSYRLPNTFPELTVVSDHFHIKPLLPLLGSEDRFYVLALSQKEVRLIEGTRYGASEVKLDDVAGSLAEILSGYDFEEQLQFHTRAQAAGGARAAVFHGQGGRADDLKPKVTEFLRQIDEGVRDYLKNGKTPLVLAGVESLFPLYRDVNTYSGLQEEGITGNPEALSSEDLRRRAWELLEPQFNRARTVASDRYHARAGTGLASSDLKEVVAAAHDGRVESLFVALGVQIWGRFDDQNRSVAVNEEPESQDRDLLDLCAVHTFLNQGSVYVVDPKEVPGGNHLAAVFRY